MHMQGASESALWKGVSNLQLFWSEVEEELIVWQAMCKFSYTLTPIY